MHEQSNPESNNRQPDYDINPLYIKRWSSRSFLEDDVPADVLFSLFEAARWAPSANNHQPWRYIIARDAQARAKFHSFIHASNLAWCVNVPVLALAISSTLTESGKKIGSHAFDTGASWGYLALEATNQGLAAHAMGGFDKEMARLELDIPDDYDIHCVIAIGYRGPIETLPEQFHLRENPNERRPITDSLFEGSFGRNLNNM